MTPGWGWRQLLMLLLVVVGCGALIALLQDDTQASSTGGAKATPASILELQAEVQGLEKRIAEIAAKASEEKQLMIRLLDASTQRLDALCRAIENGEATPVASEPTDSLTPRVRPDPTEASGAAAAPPSSSFFDDFDYVQAGVTFLAVSLLLLVAIVVFFPGRLRGTIPAIEYTAEPDPVEVPEFGVTETPARKERAASEPPPPDAATGPAIVPMSRRFPDPPVIEGNPVPHSLSIGLGDQKSLEGLVSVLDSYLNTEPYILRNPAPRVAMDKGQLHLKFYALPTLSKAEHALLDATVQGLRPGAQADQEPREAWGDGSEPDSRADSFSAPLS